MKMLSFLKGVMVASVAAVFALPIVAMLYVFPAFTEQTVRNAEEESVLIATHIKRMVFPGGGEFNRDMFDYDVLTEISTVRRDFNIDKIRVFSATGEIIYSSDYDELGQVNTKPYFRRIVAAGDTYSMMVEKGERTLEGREVQITVVETYVPVMRSGDFLGAFEIYRNVTEMKAANDRLVLVSYAVTLSIAMVLLLAVALTVRRAGLTLRERDEAEVKFQKAFRSSPEWMTISTLEEGRYVEVNDTFVEMSGYSREEVLGRTSSELGIWVNAGERRDMIKILREKGTMKDQEATFRTKSGKLLTMLRSAELIEIDGKECVINMGRDITDRKKMQDRLEEMSITDELTGLYNRRGFYRLAEHQQHVARREKRTMQVCYFDVDGMKKINDSYGHAEGDNALKDVASILKAVFRKSDIVARIGGDEFAVLMTYATEVDVAKVSARIQENLDEFNAGGTRKYKLGVSVGSVVLDPAKSESIEEFLARADRLMYERKKARAGP